MFGAEAIAQMTQYPGGHDLDTDKVGAIPQEYMIPCVRMLHPWVDPGHSSIAGFEDDFIMIAEFSEIEGPRPVILLPKDGGGKFDTNNFALRIMSVDHQSSVSVGFHLTEDIQVVRSDLEQGVYAFVHHFVLHDHHARGFVRPFSMSYITRDHRKLMTFYEDISLQMKKVSRMFRYGNRLVFVKDLECHLRDLDHTKEVLIHRHGRKSELLIEGENEDDILRSLKDVETSGREIRDIINVLVPLLNDKKLEERFHKMEQKAKVDDRKSSFDASSLQDCDYERAVMQKTHITFGSLGDSETPESLVNWNLTDYKPRMIHIDGLRRKFDKPLRGFHQLCSWGAKDGLQRLRAVLEHFMEDMAKLELDQLDSHLMDPPSSLLSFSHGTIGANLMTDVDMLCIGTTCCIRRRISPGSQRFLERWSSYETIDSFKSATSSCPSPGDENDPMMSAKSSILGTPISPSTVSERSFCEVFADDFADLRKPVISGSSGAVSPSMSLSRNDSGGSLDKQHVQNKTQIKTIRLRSSNQRNSTTDVEQEEITLSEPCITDSLAGAKTELDTKSKLEEMTKSQSPDTDTEKYLNDSIIARCTAAESPPVKTRNLPGCESETKNHEVTEKQVSDSGNLSTVDIKSSKSKISTSCPENSSSGDGKLMESGTKSLDPVVFASDMPPKSATCDYFSKDTDIDTVCSPAQGETLTDNSMEIVHCADNSAMTLTDNTRENSCQNSNKPVHGNLSDLGEILSEVNTDDVILSSMPCNSGDTGVDSDSSKTSETKMNFRSASFGTSRLSESIEKDEKSAGMNFPQGGEINVGSSLSSGKGCTTDAKVTEWYNRPEVLEQSRNASPQTPEEDLPGSDENSLSHLHKRRDSDFQYYNTNELTMTTSCPEFSMKKLSLFSERDSLGSVSPFFSGPFLHKLLNSYMNLQHVIYSLLIGRPVVVMGSDKFEMEVREVVHALRIFLPTFLRHSSQFSDWYKTKQLKLSDLSNFKLCGLCRPDKKNIEHIILQSVKKYVTVIDVEKRVIQGPLYQGDIVYGILNKRKVYKTEEALVSYIEMCLTDLSSKAFIFYHCYCLNGRNNSETRGTKLSSSLTASAPAFLGKLGINHNDCDIVQYLADVIKFQQIEEHHQLVHSTEMPVRPIPVTYSTCLLFRC